MKNIKKLLSIVMMLALVLSLGAQAFAANITVNGRQDAGSTYNAYQLLTAEYERTDEIKDENVDVYVYHINPKYIAAIHAGIAKVTGEVKSNGKVVDPPTISAHVTTEVEKQVLEYLSNLNEDQIRQFADAAFKSIQDAGLVAEGSHTVTVDEAKGESVEITGEEGAVLPGGYYLVSEVLAEKTGEEAVASLVMLDTAGKANATVEVKEEVPQSDKKVKETNDTTGKVTSWVDGADYDIGDTIPYRLSATIPAKGYAEYDTYYLQFVDDMSKGLIDPKTVAIYWVAKGADVNDEATHHDIKGSFVGPTAATGIASEYEGGAVYTWTCNDIKTIGVEAGATVYLEYTAVLSGDGVKIGEAGNPNKSYIVYSGNPYGEGTSRTPDDKVTVFTFTIEADKVDGNEAPLEGAGFTLLKKVPTPDSLPEGAVKVNYDGLKTADVGNYYQVTTDGETTTYVVVEKEMIGVTEFQFKGQDSGEYLLVETTVPAGYNKADDITFTVNAEYDQTSADPKLTGLTVTPPDAGFKCEPSTGVVSTKVVNQSGLELPETGGIGTTIFYIAGAVLVAGAVILLVTKKRAGGASK